MDDYPHWNELSLADQLWIAALEAKRAKVKAPFVNAMHEAAVIVEQLDEQHLYSCRALLDAYDGPS